MLQGGVIFGASFGDDFTTVNQAAIDSLRELPRLQGSKYLQSKTHDTFRQVRTYLRKGRIVLYSGTPCQIAGLLSVLKKEDCTNLITIDVMCHGVASPTIWAKYLKQREKEANDTAKSVSFRKKIPGEKSYSLCIEFEYGSYQKCMNVDPYMQGYLRNAFLRYSCYKCRYKAIERCSDLTIGDYQGNESFTENDDDGLSIVLIHTEKGRKIFEKACFGSTYLFKIDDASYINNGGLYSSAFYNIERKRLENNVEKYSFTELEERYFSDKFITRVRRQFSRMISKYYKQLSRLFH